MRHRLHVAVEVPQHAGLERLLCWTHEQPLPPGTLVRVPLGRRETLGVVWEPDTDVGETLDERSLKPVAAVLDSVPPLDAAWRRLVAFAADYYRRSLGEMALSVLPPELRTSDAQALARRCRRLSSRPLGGEPATLPELTPEQQEVLAMWQASADASPASADSATSTVAQGTALLFGATGSGKTEVYLRLAAQALAEGRQVLVLVPEINLTPQLEARLAARFVGHRLVTLHSGLTPAQRLNHWLMAHLGQADVVLGTRLAVLAPLPRLGLIIVDEEHDPSYKQQEGARYSARDLAVWRGRSEGFPVMLGSATPSLESWRHAQQGRYRLLRMPTRVGGGRLPAVRLIDMSQQPRATAGSTALAPPLVAAVQARIDRGEQSLLLLNRRGYAPVLHCTGCGWKSGCAHCSAWQVFHKVDRTLRCHHCGAAQRVPRACPACGDLDLQAVGRGTERLEEQLPPLLRGREGVALQVLRIDADTTRRAGSLQAQLAAVHEGDVDVLVGTQMVAKGHDFRRMTLVAAVNPDGALFSSDFRAPERLFALLMQAAGRAGRDALQSREAEMWIQTWHPTHSLYQCLKRHDFEAFAQSQLEEREAVGLPPFSHLALLRVEARTTEVAEAYLLDAQREARSWVEAHAAELITLYPSVPAAVARVADRERLQMLVESSSRPVLQALLRDWWPRLNSLRERHRGVLRWALDVDPTVL